MTGCATAAPIKGGTIARPAATNLSIANIDWRNWTLPSSACSTASVVILHDGTGDGASIEEHSPAAYGELDGDGIDEAAVPIHCDKGDSPNKLLIYELTGASISLVGVLPTTQAHHPGANWPFIDNSQTHFGRGVVTVAELWYEPADGDGCCPSTLARSVWRYEGNHLMLTQTVRGPRPRPHVQLKDFVGEWFHHGVGLSLGLTEGSMSFSHAGYCTSDKTVECDESLYFHISPTPDGQALDAKVISDHFSTPNGVEGSPTLYPSSLGDVLRIQMLYPDLLQISTVATASGGERSTHGSGTVYCNNRTVSEIRRDCGA